MMSSKPFSNLMASGHGEVFDITNADKFKQFGWRCNTNENAYKPETMIGNWNEERFDMKYIARKRPIRSPFSHYYETTHHQNFRGDRKNEELPVYARLLEGISRESPVFPHHQPSLDPQNIKCKCNRFESTSMATYKDPNVMKN